MNIEAVTDPLSIDDLWDDLHHNIQLLAQMKISRTFCFFGFSWGKHIYEGKWDDIPVERDQITPLIRKYEKLEYGRLGDDNIYITIPELDAKVSYTHEVDIHLSYSTVNPFVRQILDRWESEQWLSKGNYR